MNPETPPRSLRVKPAKPLPPAVERSIDDYVARSVPDKYQLSTLRALKGQTMKAASVKMKCMQCAGYQRDEVTRCTVVTCALHMHRPYQKAGL